MTDQPNFDQRITAAERGIIDLLTDAFSHAPRTSRLSRQMTCPHPIWLAMDHISTACAIARDYARQQARTALTAEAQTLGMYDVTDGHEDDR